MCCGMGRVKRFLRGERIDTEKYTRDGLYTGIGDSSQFCAGIRVVRRDR